MKPIFLTLSMFLFMSQNTWAQQAEDYEISQDVENGRTIFTGEITFETLLKEPSFAWYKNGIAAYQPDSAAIAELKPVISNYNIIVILGTWCGDSHKLIPELYQVLQKTKFPMSQYRMYGVNRAKQTKYQEHIAYKVDRVPIIIIRRGPMEIGRIVETAKEKLEQDMAKIILADAQQQ